jgi:hypothetical protein
MEFLRFGSSIPGGYWGCCACCIIQDFNQDPDAKASIQLVSGDGGGGLTRNGGTAFAGPTYGDIFKTRIRIGTFSTSDMPDHTFFAILTAYQVNNSIGKKWLALLKAEGFEFVRASSNSVYTGATVPKTAAAKDSAGCPHINYIFGLFRNIQASRVVDPLKPPESWTALPEQSPEMWALIPEADRKAFTDAQTDFGRKRWAKTSPTVIATMADIVKAGAPVIMAGLRSANPPEPKETREAKSALKPVVDPFAKATMGIAITPMKAKI